MSVIRSPPRPGQPGGNDSDALERGDGGAELLGRADPLENR
ncbi:hypothetical protein [Streptomyces sp. NPDC047042]